MPVLKLRPLVRHAIMNRIFWEPVRGFGGFSFSPLLSFHFHFPPYHLFSNLLPNLLRGTDMTRGKTR